MSAVDWDASSEYIYLFAKSQCRVKLIWSLLSRALTFTLKPNIFSWVSVCVCVCVCGLQESIITQLMIIITSLTVASHFWRLLRTNAFDADDIFNELRIICKMFVHFSDELHWCTQLDSVDSYGFFWGVPREEATRLRVGWHSSSSEEDGVGERDDPTRGPGGEGGEDVRACCPGLRWGGALYIGDLRCCLIFGWRQEATLWSGGPVQLPGGLGFGPGVGPVL